MEGDPTITYYPYPFTYFADKISYLNIYLHYASNIHTILHPMLTKYVESLTSSSCVTKGVPTALCGEVGELSDCKNRMH